MKRYLEAIRLVWVQFWEMKGYQDKSDSQPMRNDFLSQIGVRQEL